MLQPILRVDLTNKSVTEYIVPRQWEIDFLGGATLAARLLYEGLTPDLDPLSPDASLLFLCGPLTGTSGPAVGRFVVCAKSPATRLWGESNCGGFWGPELRMAGYDGLWITGKADKPVYISIVNKELKINSAENLWGLDTYTTQSAIKSELGIKNARVAVIGIAGENGIPFASILTDHGRMAGRTGMGAVMGSKNLKGIAVKGNGRIPIANPQDYSPIRSKANQELKADSFSQVFHELGSAGGADYFDYLAEMPKRYFTKGVYKNAVNVSGANIAESILVATSTCHACVIACGRVVDLGDGIKRKGPEYETLVGFGPNLLFDDPSKITLLGELCDQYGMDTISVSNTIGLLFKLSEMGKITGNDFSGSNSQWGNFQAIEKLVHQTARREGMGEWIAKGARALALHFGCEDEAVQVNGLEVPYHDPRGASGMALVYATSPRGACHNQSDYFLIDIGQVLESIGMEAIDRQAGAEKSKNVAIHQNWRTVANSLVMCIFANVPAETVMQLINKVYDVNWNIEELLTVGERGWNLKRVINNRLGLSRKNDKLPKEFQHHFYDNPQGANKYVPDFKEMLDKYYEIRGWDNVTGYPAKEKLISIGLGWLVEDIW